MPRKGVLPSYICITLIQRTSSGEGMDKGHMRVRVCVWRGGGSGAKLGLSPKTIKYSPFHLKDNMLSLSIKFSFETIHLWRSHFFFQMKNCVCSMEVNITEE